jgi:hypothetical protein
MLCQCLPVLDGICQCSLNVFHSCVHHSYALIRFLAMYGIVRACRADFPSHYNCSINNLIYGRVSHIINAHVNKLISDDMLGFVTFLRAPIMIGDVA